MLRVPAERAKRHHRRVESSAHSLSSRSRPCWSPWEEERWPAKGVPIYGNRVVLRDVTRSKVKVTRTLQKGTRNMKKGMKVHAKSTMTFALVLKRHKTHRLDCVHMTRYHYTVASNNYAIDTLSSKCYRNKYGSNAASSLSTGDMNGETEPAPRDQHTAVRTILTSRWETCRRCSKLE